MLAIHKNLVYGPLLNKYRFCMIFECDKFVLTKTKLFVRKDYKSGNMFKFTVMIINLRMNNENNPSAYVLESSNLWHSRLGYVSYNPLSILINLNHILTFQMDSKHKYENCVEAKLRRSSFQRIEMNTKPLDLIHSDVCDLKFMQTRGGNKYFNTFVDDSMKYYYTYLLKNKDEAIKKFSLYKKEVENQLNKKIKVLTNDKGGEYDTPFVSSVLITESYTELQHLIHPSRIVLWNKKKNRTLKEIMNVMLLSSRLP